MCCLMTRCHHLISDQTHQVIGPTPKINEYYPNAQNAPKATKHTSGFKNILLLILIPSPLYQIQIGNGIPITIANPASRELPPPYPMRTYMSCPKRGNANPRRDWKTATAEMADAVYWKASTR